MPRRIPSVPRGSALAVLLLAVGGGALECSRQELTREAKHGQELYGRMCAVCHGEGGEGYRADQAPAIGHAAFLGSVSEEFLRVAITNGRAGTTMSAWSEHRGGPLDRADVTAVVTYLRSLHRSARPKLDESPLRGDATRGKATFEKECVVCHGPRGRGGTSVSIGDRELLTTATNGFLRNAIRDGRAGTPMPAFAAKLGDQGVEDVLAAVRSFREQPHQQEPEAPRKAPPLPLGPVPLHPGGPEAAGFEAHPGTTPVEVVARELARGAKIGLLDSRAPSDYVREHIAGAVSVPFYDPSPYIAKLPKDAWLVAYCACPSAESRALAARLASEGFTKVTVLREGLGVWKSKGHPMHQGEAP
ncbi:MAG: c-type cytochrome [Deltaproteobacteria bacterium]|nr:c-type cytochrome [Deltaproteobacteria bacterium]